MIWQFITMVLAYAIVAVSVHTDLIEYMPYIIGIFCAVLLVYLIFHRLVKRKWSISGNNFEIGLIITIVLLVVFYTGGISSPLFFFVYFLMFGSTFIFSPIIVLVFFIGFLAVSFPAVIASDVAVHSLQMGSLLFLSIVAFIFSKEHEKVSSNNS